MKAMEVFVAILGASQLTYVEAVESQRWRILSAVVRTHFTTSVDLPMPSCRINLKSAVIKSNRYEPRLNENF